MSDDDKPLTLGKFKTLMSEHEANEAADKRQMVDEFMSAFPGGDPVPHREYHQAKINAANAEKSAEEARKRMYDAFTSKIVDKGIEGVFGVAKILVIIALVSAALKFGVSVPSWLLK